MGLTSGGGNVSWCSGTSLISVSCGGGTIAYDGQVGHSSGQGRQQVLWYPKHPKLAG
jgi:hypothetical protein